MLSSPLSAEEKKQFGELITAFRAGLKEEFEAHPDSLVVREVTQSDGAVVQFLNARAQKVPAAQKLFRECLAYRTEHKIDDILNDPAYDRILLIREHYPHFWHGYDKLGRVIYVERTGRLDIPKLLTVTGEEELIDYHMVTNEYLVRRRMDLASKRAGRRVDQLLTIVDLDGLGWSHLCRATYSFLSTMSAIDKVVYPEILGKLFIVNAPRLFSVAWRIIRTFLDERICSKISILSHTGTEEMLEVVDEETLPRFLGGKCDCDEKHNGCMNHDMSREFVRFAKAGGLNKCPDFVVPPEDDDDDGEEDKAQDAVNASGGDSEAKTE